MTGSQQNWDYYRKTSALRRPERSVDQKTCYTADPESNLIEIGSWNKPGIVTEDDFRWATEEASKKKKQGYELDITDKRLHHEIYLSDARKVAPEKMKTVIRHPIREKEK